MFARLLILFYAIVSYAVFLVSFLCAVGFVGNYLVPKSIDVGGRTNLSEAIVVDLLLLGIFAIQQTSRTPSSLLRHENAHYEAFGPFRHSRGVMSKCARNALLKYDRSLNPHQ